MGSAPSRDTLMWNTRRPVRSFESKWFEPSSGSRSYCFKLGPAEEMDVSFVGENCRPVSLHSERAHPQHLSLMSRLAQQLQLYHLT